MTSFFSHGKKGEKFHSVALANDQEALFGPLVKEDNEWLCASGFVAETQVFYATTPTGGLLMVQVIHSSVGFWSPSIQFTFRYAEPSKGIHVFKATSVSGFASPPSGGKYDKRSCKADQFTILLDPATPNKYIIEGKHDSEIQISIQVERLAEGWKVGKGPRGGFTYFGSLAAPHATESNKPDTSAGGDGYCVHRFWPRCAFTGIVRVGKEVVDLESSRGTFIHAIQGLRPNVLASRWNFGNFQTSAKDGISLVMMEFQTTKGYGGGKVNVGSVVVDDKLVAVVAGGDGVVGGSSVEHQDLTFDKDTEYEAPGKIAFLWEGASLGDGGAVVKGAPKTKATLLLDLATHKAGEPYQTKGLVEKVDFLAHVPKIVKTVIAVAAGTRPYIYTWLNPVKATITVPTEANNPSSQETKTIEIEGHLFNEATYIS